MPNQSAFQLTTDTKYGKHFLEKETQYHQARIQHIKKSRSKSATLDNKISPIALRYRKFRKKSPCWKPVGWTKQVIDAMAKGHNELLCRSSSHIVKRLATPVEHIRERMRMKTNAPSRVTQEAIEYNQRRLREHIVQAMPIVDNRLSESTKNDIRMYHETRRPCYEPSPLEAQMEARNAAIHNDLLLQANPEVDHRVHHAVQKARKLRKQHPKWKRASEELIKEETEMRRHNSIIRHTLPRVDSATPTGAMHHMKMRHRRPDLDKGSYVEQNRIKQHIQYHNRMLEQAGAQVDSTAPRSALPLLARRGELPIGYLGRTHPEPRRAMQLSPMGEHDQGEGMYERAASVPLGELPVGLAAVPEEYGPHEQPPGYTPSQDELPEEPSSHIKDQLPMTPPMVLRQPWSVRSRPTTRDLDPFLNQIEIRQELCTPPVARFPLFGPSAGPAFSLSSRFSQLQGSDEATQASQLQGSDEATQAAAVESAPAVTAEVNVTNATSLESNEQATSEPKAQSVEEVKVEPVVEADVRQGQEAAVEP